MLSPGEVIRKIPGVFKQLTFRHPSTNTNIGGIVSATVTLSPGPGGVQAPHSIKSALLNPTSEKVFQQDLIKAISLGVYPVEITYYMIGPSIDYVTTAHTKSPVDYAPYVLATKTYKFYPHDISIDTEGPRKVQKTASFQRETINPRTAKSKDYIEARNYDFMSSQADSALTPEVVAAAKAYLQLFDRFERYASNLATAVDKILVYDDLIEKYNKTWEKYRIRTAAPVLTTQERERIARSKERRQKEMSSKGATGSIRGSDASSVTPTAVEHEKTWQDAMGVEHRGRVIDGRSLASTPAGSIRPIVTNDTFKIYFGLVFSHPTLMASRYMRYMNTEVFWYSNKNELMQAVGAFTIRFGVMPGVVIRGVYEGGPKARTVAPVSDVLTSGSNAYGVLESISNTFKQNESKHEPLEAGASRTEKRKFVGRQLHGLFAALAIEPPVKVKAAFKRDERGKIIRQTSGFSSPSESKITRGFEEKIAHPNKEDIWRPYLLEVIVSYKPLGNRQFSKHYQDMNVITGDKTYGPIKDATRVSRAKLERYLRAEVSGGPWSRFAPAIKSLRHWRWVRFQSGSGFPFSHILHANEIPDIKQKTSQENIFRRTRKGYMVNNREYESYLIFAILPETYAQEVFGTSVVNSTIQKKLLKGIHAFAKEVDPAKRGHVARAELARTEFATGGSERVTKLTDIDIDKFDVGAGSPLDHVTKSGLKMLKKL
jgi:hypothetical protein